jgi:surface protein
MNLVSNDFHHRPQSLLILECGLHNYHVPVELLAIIRSYYREAMSNQSIREALTVCHNSQQLSAGERRSVSSEMKRCLMRFGHISDWDTSQVTDMSRLFQYAPNFNEDISAWDTGNVTTLNSLFSDAWNFNQPLATWNVQRVTDMSSMFQAAYSFNQSLETWDCDGYVENVTDMSNMFNGASKFNQPLAGWNVANAVDMRQMFRYASTFNQPLDRWDVTNVIHMKFMFQYASSFNQPLQKFETQYDPDDLIEVSIFNESYIWSDEYMRLFAYDVNLL